MKRWSFLLGISLLFLVLYCSRDELSKFIVKGRYEGHFVTLIDPGKYRFVVDSLRHQIEKKKDYFIKMASRYSGLETDKILYYSTAIDTINHILLLRYFCPLKTPDPIYAGVLIQFVYNEKGMLQKIYIDKIPYE